MNAEEASWKLNLPVELTIADRASIAALIRSQADDLKAIESHYRRWAPIIVPANDGWIVCGNSKTTHSTLADACRAAAAPKAN